MMPVVSHAKTAGDPVPLQGPDVSRLVPPDLTFAAAFVQSLSDSGWDVQAVRHSKFNGGLFGTTKAAWVKTDKGIFEVVFFEKADEVEQIQIREEQDSTPSRHRYTVTCATGNHPWEGRLPVYFTKHGILLIISHDRQLADALNKFFGYQGRSASGRT
jgi:hypothetical protein